MMMHKDITKFFEELNEEKKLYKSNKKISFDIACYSFFLITHHMLSSKLVFMNTTPFIIIESFVQWKH